MGIPKKTRTEPRVERSAEGMHTCPNCSSELVQPVNWHEQGNSAELEFAGLLDEPLRCEAKTATQAK